MGPEMSRRELLGAVSGGGCRRRGGGRLCGTVPANADPFVYCLNTSTIRGQNLSIVDEIGIAQRAGYQAIEPWINELERYTAGGGDLRDLAKRIQDAGLCVESAIGFAEWVVDDEGQRRKGLERARIDMDMVQRIGGRRLAAPPRRDESNRSFALGRRGAPTVPCAKSANGSALCRRSKSGAFLGHSTAWKNARWSRSNRAIATPVSWPTSIICTKGGPASTVSACSTVWPCRSFT